MTYITQDRKKTPNNHPEDLSNTLQLNVQIYNIIQLDLLDLIYNMNCDVHA